MAIGKCKSTCVAYAMFLLDDFGQGILMVATLSSCQIQGAREELPDKNCLLAS